jgi:hypothetical protein
VSAALPPLPFRFCTEPGSGDKIRFRFKKISAISRRMKHSAKILLLVLLLAGPCLAKEAPVWPMPSVSYFVERIPPPPNEGDAADLSDLDYVLAVQHTATPAQIAHAKKTEKLDPSKKHELLVCGDSRNSRASSALCNPPLLRGPQGRLERSVFGPLRTEIRLRHSEPLLQDGIHL